MNLNEAYSFETKGIVVPPDQDLETACLSEAELNKDITYKMALVESGLFINPENLTITSQIEEGMVPIIYDIVVLWDGRSVINCSVTATFKDTSGAFIPIGFCDTRILKFYNNAIGQRNIYEDGKIHFLKLQLAAQHKDTTELDQHLYESFRYHPDYNSSGAHGFLVLPEYTKGNLGRAILFTQLKLLQAMGADFFGIKQDATFEIGGDQSLSYYAQFVPPAALTFDGAIFPLKEP